MSTYMFLTDRQAVGVFFFGGAGFLFFSIHPKHTQPSLLRLRGGSYYMAKAALFSLHATKAGNHIRFYMEELWIGC